MATLPCITSIPASYASLHATSAVLPLQGSLPHLCLMAACLQALHRNTFCSHSLVNQGGAHYFIQPFLNFESDSLQRNTALGQLSVAGYPTSIEKPLGVACTAAAPPTSTGSQLDDLDWSFLSPLQSCKSPGLSHLRKSPRFSPAQSLSPARGIHSLAHAFEQVGLLTFVHVYIAALSSN